ncbi:UNVERIFIED_CONTAM: Acyl carrier protein 4, chloroplastic [Sesamum calycinum]|uniref:Acyl carrier protein n=1 Tax=Sesamum calycinum TaxID=2727403 RepID=A0AAW2SXY1_9LAMI
MLDDAEKEQEYRFGVYGLEKKWKFPLYQNVSPPNLWRLIECLSVHLQAKAETVEKVSEIVRKQLALSPETQLTPQTKFSELGADSLDTVEIVMGLEEEYDINVEEENSENITTIQEAADLIDKLVEKKT